MGWLLLVQFAFVHGLNDSLQEYQQKLIRMNKAVLLLIGMFLLASCSDSEDPIGKWDDKIKLSTKNVSLKANKDSVTITTRGSWWWIDGIAFDGTTYSYYNSDEVDLESDSYSIKEEEFVVERREKTTLFVKLSENKTGKERVMNITLEAGNYFDYVSIKQVAK